MFWIWAAFILFILALLALDLGVFHRKAHVVRIREALIWSTVWIALGLSFSVFVYFAYENHWLGVGTTPDFDGGINDGSEAMLKYLIGYVVEKSLSVDNIFVIAMIFGFLAVPAIYQHRVLFWGIIGALLMRGAMIAVGSALIRQFQWVLYIFGVFLILTAIKMLLIKAGSHPGQNIVVRFVRRFFPITDTFHGEHFILRSRTGALMLTPLSLALVMVETTDLVFALDSIPAIFAITADPFLVFTSNVFAILGLRSLYFALAHMIEMFRYLKLSLAIVLAVVGVKMLVHHQLKELLGPNFNLYLLGLVLGILASGVIASIIVGRRQPFPSAETSQPTEAGA